MEGYWEIVGMEHYTGSEYDYLPADDTHANTIEMKTELITLCPDGTIKITQTYETKSFR